MKQFLRYTLTLVAILMVTNLIAQTYNDGTWYSLYDTNEYEINTIGEKLLNTFTPTGSSLSFEAKRQPSGLGNLQVAPIVNGSQQSNIFNSKPGTVTENYPWYLGGGEKTVVYATYSASVSNQNTNQLKFYTVIGATLSKYFKNVKLPLAKHILLNDGTAYGTTTINAGNQTSLATSVRVRSSSAYTIKLRSFLASGNITITSSNSEFHFADGSNKISLGTANNYCASANGSGKCTSASKLGQISSYDTPIYFTPKSNIKGNCSTTITITDGTNSATITLSAPIKPTYYFYAQAIAYTGDAESTTGGTTTVTFNDGKNQDTYSIVADHTANNATTTATYTAVPNIAGGYVFDGWKTSPNATEYVSRELTMTGVAITSNSLSSPATAQQTYYAMFVQKYNPEFKGSTSQSMMVDGTWEADFEFINTQTTQPTNNSADPFYYTISHSFGNNTIKKEGYEEEVITYDPTNNTITARNAGTAIITFVQNNTQTHNYKQFQCTITVNKHQTQFYLNLNATYYVDDEITKSALFSSTTNTEVPVTVTDSKSYFTYTNDILKANGTELPSDADQTTITVTQPENYKWTSYSLNKTVTVKKYDSQFAFTKGGADYICKIDESITKEEFYTLGNTEIPATIQVEIISYTDADHPEVLIYNSDKNQWEAKSAGKAKVTISQQEHRKWTAYSGTRIVEIQKHTPTFKWHNQPVATSTDEYFNETYTDFFTTDNTDTEIEIKSQSDTDVANLYFVDGDTHTLDLTIYYKETTPASSTKVTVYQAENWLWYAHEETKTITPKNQNNHVKFTITNDNHTIFEKSLTGQARWKNDGYQLGDGGWTSRTDEVVIAFTGIPDTLYFDKVLEKSVGQLPGTYLCRVYESIDGENWGEYIWERNEREENYKGVVPLSSTTKFIKFYYDGTVYCNYRNIHVTELNQFEATPAELDFETLYITDTPSKTMTFDLNYANAGHKVVLELDRTGTLANEEEYQRAQKYVTIQPTFIDTIGGEHVGSVEDIQVILSSPDQTGYNIPEDARIKISDEAGDTTYVALKGNIAKSTQTITWNDYFSLQEPIQIPISTDTIRNAATATCKLPVKYRSDNEAVIKINEDSLSFYPVGTGTATITAYQTGNEQYAYVEDTKQVQVTEKSIQLIDWRDDLSDLILREDAPAVPLTAQVYIIDVVNNTFEHSEEQTAKLVYTVGEGGESIISVESTTLTLVGLGETTLTVTIAADDSHEGATMTIPVIVREPAIGCEDELLLDQTAPTEIFTEGINTDQVIKPAIAIDRSKGVPGYLKFEHKGEYWKLTGLINYYAGTIKAQQSTDDGNTWTDVPGSEIKPTVGTYNPTSLLPIDRNATHIRFVRPSGGQGYHYYRNVQVYPAQYLETNTTEIPYGDINMGGKYDTKKFTISYSNIKSPLMATTSSKDVTVSPSYFGDCGDFGTREIQITWQPSTQQNQYIIFQDTLADLSIRVDLTANIQLYKQKIVWENRPKAILDHTGIDNRPLYTRDANSNEELIDLPITYEVINSDSAYFENGMFFILNTDTINIKASSPGNNKYLAVDSIYQIIIQGIPPTFVGNTAEGADSLWTTSTNWVNEVMPTDDRPANIVAPVQINTEINVQGVRVAESGSIHITSTGGLTVGEGGIQTVTTDGSTIIIDNLHSGAGFFRISPDCEDELPRITMRYQTKSTLDSGANKDATWQYIGAPGEDASVHVDYNTWLYRLDESQADWVLMPQHNNHTLSPFQGYALTQYGQPTYEWNAQMTNRNCTIPLRYHFDGRKGQNLIANSYTAPIDVTQMLPEDFQMIEGQSEYYDITQTLYLYNSGSWKAWHTQDSLGTGISSDGNNTTPGQYYAIPVLAVAEGYIPERPTIAPMQGIYVRVRAKKTGGDTHVGNIIFDYDRIVMGEGHNMHRPMRAPKKSDIASIPSENFRRLRIVATSEHSGADRLYIIQDDINTRNYDNGYDAPNQATQGIVNIYTYESGGKMEVSCANNIDSTYIGFMAGEDRTYTLHFNTIVGETLCLQDLVSGEKIYIVEDGTYTFEAEPQSTNNKRFLLHAKRAINSDMEDVNAAHIWFSNHTLYVTNATDNSLLQLYDVSGHMIFSSTIHRTPYTVDLTHLTEGVYMARVNNQVYKFVCK